MSLSGPSWTVGAAGWAVVGETAAANDRLASLNTAYSTLKDEDARRVYDAQRAADAVLGGKG